MRRRVILWAVLLALALVLVFAVTAAAKPAAPHFQTHALGTFDRIVGPGGLMMDGVWYHDGTSFVAVDGRISLKVDIESTGEAVGPYDDGSDFAPKWDYPVEGYMKVGIHLIDPYGNRVVKNAKIQVQSVTVCWAYLNTFYFFDCTYNGVTYLSQYIGSGASDWHIYMPVIGEILGGWDNYPIVHSSRGDFSYELNDTLSP